MKDILETIFVLVLVIFMSILIIGFAYNKGLSTKKEIFCNQEVISQLSGINERLDNVMFGQNYLSRLIDNK